MQNQNDFRIDNATAFVTGAGSGIGRASVLALAQYGARLIYISGRRRTLLEETRQLVSEAFPSCTIQILDGDVTSPAWRQKVAGEVFAGGPLDILVNNAGIYHSTRFEDTSDAELHEVLLTNIEAVFSLTRHLLPSLERSTFPAIVNIGSTLSIRPIAQGAGYNIAKAAVDHLSRSLALELGPRGIRVNCIAPGIVETPMYRDRFSSEEAYREAIDQARVWHPLGRVGSPEDIAKAVVFLGSPAASWITGVVLPVDGGLLLS